MRVAVLGCGPAGLLAVHAATKMEQDVQGFSRMEKSPMGGAQYVHEKIPDLDMGPEFLIDVVKVGTRQGYASKVYGDPAADVSWDFYGGQTRAWGMEAMYRDLWKRYADEYESMDVAPGDLAILLDDFDLVICSIPRRVLCGRGCEFKSKMITLAPSTVVNVNNTIMYNGRSEDEWYRTSLIRGEAWMEWPHTFAGRPIPEQLRARFGEKPISTDCTCHPEVARVGRFGVWSKGVLVHDAYHDAAEAISALL